MTSASAIDPPRPLTDAEAATFAADGVLVARGLLADADLAPVRDELAAAIDRRAVALHAEGALREMHRDAPFATRFGLLMAQTPRIQDGFDVEPLRGREMFRFFSTPRLLDALERLIGPEISCNPIAHIRAKPPQAQTADDVKGYFSVPWHQDSGVTLAEADASEIVTVWLPLTEATEEMGCLQVLPGAHRLGHLPHDRVAGYGTTIRADRLPRIAPRKLPVRGGDVVFMHRHCPHHSTPNRSQRCRWSLDLRFQRTGDHNGRPWQPDVVVRSRRDPASAMTSYERWCGLWDECLAKPGGGRIEHRLAST
ncbi:MAG TPA: phytanoyl-CoA dioxygenase family protein [Planctomycetota bacterium]|nr:phytanoyl-CoA dioxygenase family protein [Planctomycetota bacterium]